MGFNVAQRLLLRVPNNQTPRQAFQWILQNEIKPAFLQWLSGHQALANNAQVTFHWQEPCTVGNTVSFTIKVICLFLFDRNGIAVNARYRRFCI